MTNLFFITFYDKITCIVNDNRATYEIGKGNQQYRDLLFKPTYHQSSVASPQMRVQTPLRMRDRTIEKDQSVIITSHSDTILTNAICDIQY